MKTLPHRSVLVLVTLVTATATRAAPPERMEIKGPHCCWDGRTLSEAMKGDQLFAFESPREAQEWVKKITQYAGLEPNFDIVAANVPNAVATIRGKRRLVLYNPKFMADMDAGSKTNWGSISILAHEIGHHLQGHTLDDAGSRPETELEADSFSGFILARMGASLDEACAAIRTLPDKPSPTHPPASARLVAITTGWKNARELSGKVAEIAGKEPNKQPVPQPRIEEPKSEEQPPTGPVVSIPPQTIPVPPVQQPPTGPVVPIPPQTIPAPPVQPAIVARIVLFGRPETFILTASRQILVVAQTGQVVGLLGVQVPPADPHMAWDIQTPQARMGVTPAGQVVGAPARGAPLRVVGYVTSAR